MQYYDFTINAINAKVFGAGRYFAYYAGSAGGGDSSIVVRHDASGTSVILKPGQAFRLPDQENPASEWTLTPYTAGSVIKGTIIIGDGRIDDARISGSVEIIDGGKNRTMAGIAYSGAFNVAAVAAQYAHCGIWNPVGSGKNIVIEKLVLSASVITVMSWGTATAYLGTTNGSINNKKSTGGVTSAGILTNGASATATPTGFAYLGQIQVAANLPYTHELREPIVITPGTAFAICSNVQNVTLSATVEAFEEVA